MNVALIVVAVSGWLIALVPARLCHLDIGSYRRTLWAGVGSRHRWLRGIKIAYACAGWPAFAVALAWWTGQTRKELIEVRAQMRDSRSAGRRAGV